MILTARDISKQLTDRVESVCQWLLPGGKSVQGNWRCGSVAGEPGDSLGVQLTGPNRGIWADFAGDDKGDLLDLIVSAKAVPMRDAIKMAKEWLGIREPESKVPKKTYGKPKGTPKLAPTRNPVMEYLMNERKLDAFTLEDYKIGENLESKNGPEIVFPSYGPDGEIANVKYIALKRENGKKIVRQSAGCAPSLFGWQALKKDRREVIITEGEIDAMTWASMGFPAVSVPDGAEGETWIDYEWENLQQFDTIWLNWDSDDAGQKGVKKVAKRLGLHRCLITTIPGFKDANEALSKGATESLFSSAISDSKPLMPDRIKRPPEFRDRIMDRFYPPDGKPPGFFSALFKGEFGMRPGEISVWTGIAGHGKSVLLNQLILEAMINGWRAAIASMEMLGEQTLYRMLCQSELTNRPTPAQIDTMLGWLSGKLWIYDLLGNVNPSEIMQLMEYSFSRHGVNIFVIDSLMKCSVGSEDYDGQRMFLNDLSSFAKETGTHIHLVAHARKGRDETDSPGKLDVLGSSSIINQADNILAVWRNKNKEQKAYNTNAKNDQTEPDTIVYCHKQRETGEEFVRRLNYYKFTFRFELMGEKITDGLSIIKLLSPPQIELPVNGSSNGTEPEMVFEQLPASNERKEFKNPTNDP